MKPAPTQYQQKNLRLEGLDQIMFVSVYYKFTLAIKTCTTTPLISHLDVLSQTFIFKCYFINQYPGGDKLSLITGHQNKLTLNFSSKRLFCHFDHFQEKCADTPTYFIRVSAQLCCIAYAMLHIPYIM